MNMLRGAWCFLILLFATWILNGCLAYERGLLTPLLTRNNVLCSAEVLQSQERYFCDQYFNIRCVPGWRFEELLCAFPICPEDCNADKKQGKCLRPNLCVCRQGWKGSACNECIPRQGCARGSCQKPGECNCNEGFYGPLCNKLLLDKSFKNFESLSLQNQSMEEKMDLETSAQHDMSETIASPNDESSNEEISDISNGSVSSNEGAILKPLQNTMIGTIKLAKNTTLSEISMSESQSTNISSVEDFTAPRQKIRKPLLNSTEYFNFDSTPSTLLDADEDITSINDLERNIDSSEDGELSKADSSTKEKVDFAPRFGGIQEDYNDYSEKYEENKIKGKNKIDSIENEGQKLEERKVISTITPEESSHSIVENNLQTDSTSLSMNSDNTNGKNISTKSEKYQSNNISNEKNTLQNINQTKMEEKIGNKVINNTLGIKESIAIPPQAAPNENKGFFSNNTSASGSKSVNTKNLQKKRHNKTNQVKETNKFGKASEFYRGPVTRSQLKKAKDSANMGLKTDSNSSTSQHIDQKQNGTTGTMKNSSESQDDSQMESSNPMKKFDTTIENISTLKKDLHSIEQQLNLTYITKLMNASISLRNLGFKHCRNRITDVGHPYYSDESIFGSKIKEVITCDVRYPYYSLDGSCNSNAFPIRGMAFTPFRRVVDPIEIEGSDFELAINFEEDSFLCNKRLAVFQKQNVLYDPLVRSFASFVALDMAQCLGVIQKSDQTNQTLPKNKECPPHFEEETVNRITSFIDGSQIYGTTYHTSSNLRTMENGHLHISDGEIKKFGAQLEREESMSADLLIILFKLEHNRIATQIKDAYKNYGAILGKAEDEAIYQESRRIVIAVLQHVVYDEFLPAILGSEVYYRFELSSKKNTYYDQNLNPSIFSGFVTSFSHLFTDPCKTEKIEGISNDLFNKDKSGIKFEDHPHLIAIFSHLSYDHGYYEKYKQLCGIKDHTIQKDSWEELLQIFKGNASTIDLLSGGLMEEHDHGGLVGPTFACIIAYQFHLVKAGDRRFYSHVRRGHPAHLNTKTDKTLIQSLQQPKPKIRKSFNRQKEPKYYSNDPNLYSIRESHRFNYDEIDEIRTRTMSGLICDNGNVSGITISPFFAADRKWNHWIKCDSIVPFNVRTFTDTSYAYQIKKK